MKWDRTKGRPEPIRALNRILELDNCEPLVDIRLIAPSVRLFRPAVIPFCRQTVAHMVEAAARSLPVGYHLALVEAWRPIARQQRIYDFMWQSAVEAFPSRSYGSLRRTVCRWVAPTDQKAPPGHCTGAALDVWLIDEEGEPIDTTSSSNRFGTAPTYALGLTEGAVRNRMILLEAMLAQGFSNCRDEWWHYSFGDAGWAVRSGQETCRYGLVTMDPESYAEHEELWLEAAKERKNPFLPPPPPESATSGAST
ncbi:MAG: M15 family metallopeptidase [Fimbriimonadaceae bacterium]